MYKRQPIRLSFFRKNPALQNADIEVKNPNLSPVSRLCSLNVKQAERIIAPVSSTMNVYLKIRIRDFFISSLLSASNIFLAFFSCVSDILLPRSINIIELILIIPNPPACINSNKTSCPTPVSLSLTLTTDRPVTHTALTAVNIASINDTPCGEQNGKSVSYTHLTLPTTSRV